MVDVSQFATVAGLAILLTLIVQVVKGQIRPTIVPYLTIVLGLVLAPLIGATLGHITAWSDLLSWVLGGFFSALTSIGTYEATIDKVKNLTS